MPSPTARSARVSLAALRSRGFDASFYSRYSRSLVVRCSQCASAVICGVPCHEAGCPNRQRPPSQKES